MGIPITKFGEESIGTFFELIPGTMFRTESVPYGIGLTLSLLLKIGKGTVKTLNVNIMNQIISGKKILESIGGVKNYDKEIRTRFKSILPKIDLKSNKNIVFKNSKSTCAIEAIEAGTNPLPFTSAVSGIVDENSSTQTVFCSGALPAPIVETSLVVGVVFLISLIVTRIVLASSTCSL